LTASWARGIVGAVTWRRPSIPSFAALLAVAGAAGAQPVTYELEYSAEPGCPAQSELVREVASRTRNAEHVASGGERRFVVRLSRSGAQAEGELVLGALEAPRRVSGTTCEAVVEAMALIVAVVLDPALILDLNPPAPEPAPAPVWPPSAPTESSTPLAMFPTGAEPLSAAVLLLGGGGWIVSGPAPRALFGASVFGQIAAGSGGPALRAVLSHATTGTVEVGSGAALFELSSIRLEGCLGGLGRGGFELAGCLDLEGGRIRAEGLSRGDVRDTQVSNRLWLEAGLVTRLSWSPADPLRIELSGGAGVPLSRRAYTFENPKEIIHEPPLVVARLGLGLGGQLP
jgi:hypothetical protein